MNGYEFLNDKNGNIKITADNFNVISLIKAFNTIEANNDNVIKVMLSPDKFQELKKKADEDIFEQNNVYKKILEKNQIFNSPIIIDEKLDENIIKIIGNKYIVELFIGSLF